MSGDRFAVAGIIRTRNAVGFPLHIFDNSGLIRSFGIERPSLIPGQERIIFRKLARKSDTEIWTAHQVHYVIESWTLDGRRTASLTRNAPWFWPWPGYEVHPFTRPPNSLIAGLEQDATGQLWVAVHIADRNWQPVPQPVPLSPTPTMERPQRTDVWDKVYDTVFEVIDARRGEVMAHARVDQMLRPMGSGYYFSYSESAAGIPIYTVWRVRLER